MAIVFDAITSSVESGVVAWEFDHTPVNPPQGVLLFITAISTSDEITSVTYGGVSMTEVAGSPVSNATEANIIHAFFLGSSVPTTTATVAITHAGSTPDHYCELISYTAGADMEVADTTTASGAGANPSVSLSLGAASSACALGWATGDNTAADCTPLTNWTNRRTTDAGVRGHGCFTYDIVGTADVTAGFANSASEQYALLAVAVKEAAASGITGTGALTTSTTTASGTGSVAHTGTGALATAATTASGTGVISHTGTGALTTTATTASGTGTVTGAGTVTGTGAITVGATTASGTGTLTHKGTGALTTNVVSITGTGKLTHTGTGAITVGNVTLSGAGFLGAGITGTGAITIGNVTVYGTRGGWIPAADSSGSWSDAADDSASWTEATAASGTWNTI